MPNPIIKFNTILHQSACSTITKGVIEVGGVRQSIVKKELTMPESRDRDLASLRHEFEYLKTLQGKWVPALFEITQEQERQLGLFGSHYIMLNFGGDSLRKLIKRYRKQMAEQPDANAHHGIPLALFFPIARQIVEGLMAIHQHNIIHKDLNPNNIVYDDKQGRINIIDFGLATKISREQPMQIDLKHLHGTMPYLAPEQSGRVNRHVDYRADYYSLGITLYELLTGESPYQIDDSKDPMAWIHAHIAQMPIPLKHKRADLTSTLNNLILKLINKDARERYQNGRAILYDLQSCQAQVDEAQAAGIHLQDLPTIPLTTADVPANLTIPQRLYGREQEIATLLGAFDNILHGGTELLLVAGYSGVGKSALVQEVKQRSGSHQGYFIAGKFEQLQRHNPYHALIQALGSLIRQIIVSGSQAIIEQWRQRLQVALGDNGQLITNFIPEVATLIGAQPQMPELGPEESRNRFEITLKTFLGAIAAKEHPLALFLDDLQWSDAATLRLLKELTITREIDYLLLIGAYRNNEVDGVHPLTVALREISENSAKQANKTFYQLVLQPLSPHTINQIVADTLHQSPTLTQELSQLINGKTKGNPFFLHAMLTKLYHDELINFDDAVGKWTWELDRIRDADISDNVVEFMIGRLQQLSAESQNVLQLASCIGNQFDLKTLTLICEQPADQTARQLQLALEEEIVIPLNDYYRLAGKQKQQERRIDYRFAHDRVQQAAYALIAEQDKSQVHYRLAQLLEHSWDEQKQTENIFTLVEHYNKGREKISARSAENRLAALNLVAGRKASDSTSYQSALGYLTVAEKLMPSDAWSCKYDLRLALSDQLIETHYLSGNHEQVAAIFQEISHHAQQDIDKKMAYKTIILSNISQNRLGEAIDADLSFLNLFGLSLPRRPNVLHILVDLIKVRLALRKWDSAGLMSLPEMRDKRQLAVMEILAKGGAVAYLETPNLVPLGILKALRISLQFGNTGLSCFFYAAYGVMLCGHLEDYAGGYRMGQLALELLKKRDEKEEYAKTAFVYYTFVHHWKNHLNTVIAPLEKSYLAGKDSGDLEYAAYSMQQYVITFYYSGINLLEINRVYESNHPNMKSLNQQTPYSWYLMWWQTINNLINESSAHIVLSGAICKEDELLKTMLTAQDKTGLASLYLAKLMMCLIFEDLGQVKSQYINAEKYIVALVGSSAIPLYLYYVSLTLLALYQSGESKVNNKNILSVVRKNQKKLKQMADHCPQNILHKWQLVEAQRCWIKKQMQRAAQLFGHAISGARENEYIQEEAIGNELAAKFYLEQDHQGISNYFLTEACDCFRRWGAIAKLKQMEGQYPQLSNVRSSGVKSAILSHGKRIDEIDQYTMTTQTSSGQLDFQSVQKAAQSIASEFQLKSLVARLMNIMLENAGAQKGVLLLTSQDDDQSAPDFKVVASCDLTKSEQIDQNQMGLTEAFDNLKLPPSLINAVLHDRQPLVIAKAAQSPECQSDSYFNQGTVCSVLCLPLLNQNRLIGILHLENNLITDAFTGERCQLLEILASQAAISLENATLYANLEEKVELRTHQLSEANTELSKKNEQIHDSLRYAVNMQHSLIPDGNILKQVFRDHFVIWEPRDIVSGDIYFCYPSPKGCLLAVIDCTGHGVPGAFMTMIAGSGFDSILEEQYLGDPASILAGLNLFVTRTLHQELQDSQSDNGMDMGLCYINTEDKKITYAGAKFSLLIANEDGIKEINGDRRSVGYKQTEKSSGEFTNHTIKISQNTAYYLHSDGIVDQSGGAKGFGFGKKRFRNLLIKHYQKDFAEQKKIIVQALHEYQGNNSRRDDVTVVGFTV